MILINIIVIITSTLVAPVYLDSSTSSSSQLVSSRQQSIAAHNKLPQHEQLTTGRRLIKLNPNIKSFSNNSVIIGTSSSSIYSNNINNINNNNANRQQQQHYQKRTGLLDKICIGTSNRVSGGQQAHNKSDHYQNLAERYRNCTYVIGNLEVTWLDTNIDLSFLESIREITGYLLIAYVNVDKIRMPNLQIIRGRDLFKLNSDEREEFALILIENELKSLELPNLREILTGSVGSYNNRNLCNIRTIIWEEILNPPYKSVFVYNGTGPECPPCHSSCPGACWGEGPEMCQEFTKNSCSPQCAPSRCFGSAAGECCHSFCAGGCLGPKQSDCFACKNFYHDGECIQECPSMQRYNPSKFLWEPNPNGKYAFGATCVKECPEHLLRDNGACVRTCPPNKRSQNGECVTCPDPCPKNCQGVEVVHSGNIDQLINCTVIEGSISILDSSFTGGFASAADYSATAGSNGTSIPGSGSAGISGTGQTNSRYKPMHPSRLEVFRTLREITGYLQIQANHSDFKNLSYFRNLKYIGGRQPLDMTYSLIITKSSLVTLNLRSLRKVRNGRILIEDNRDLCFADTIDWPQTNISKREDLLTRNNAEASRCRQLGLQCHEQCARDGCWGPGPDECLSCKNYMLDDYCVDNCTTGHQAEEAGGNELIRLGGGILNQPNLLSFDAGSNTCKRCHPECAGGCNGTEARHCWQCRNVKDGPYCVAECPSHKYNNQGTCEECDKSCVDGCTGPSSKLGDGGCNSCGKAVIVTQSQPPSVEMQHSPQFVAHCIRAEEPCPEGYYQEYVGPQPEGPLKSSSGKPVCRKCHHRCKSCTGMGSHVSVCECAKYVAGEQCEDYCPRDYFADEQLRQCIKCSSECNGCSGPTEADCISCRVYRIYYDTPTPTGGPVGSDSAVAAAAVNPMATPQASAGSQWPSINLATGSRSFLSAAAAYEVQPAAAKQQVKFNCTAQCPSDKPHRISESNMLDPYCSEDPGVDQENPRIVSLGSTSVLFMLIISAAIMFCFSVYRCQIEKDKTVKLTMHLSGIDDVEPLNPSNMKPNLAPLRSIKETELRKGNILGSGFGGTVYQGFWFPEGQEQKEPRPVAIKVLRDTGQSNINKEFLDEAYIMASVSHPNLVRLLAVCMTPNHLMLVTQLMPLGCLLEYVKKHRNDIGAKNLLEWCKQIARGMSYLEDHRMVHRDLALRNVLLQTPGRALISDFGFAKFLELDQSEYQSGGGRMPIKWLAPECFRERKFTHKSDVWAFGVTVWELLTFGRPPFEEYETRDVPAAIEKGARLQQPSNMSTEVYKVMYACWFYNPDDRPNFRGLAQNFVNFARDPERYLICNTKGIEYTVRRCPSLSKKSSSLAADHHMIGDHNLSAYEDDEEYCSEGVSLTEEEPMTATLPDLTPNTHNRINEMKFGFEMRHQQQAAAELHRQQHQQHLTSHHHRQSHQHQHQHQQPHNQLKVKHMSHHHLYHGDELDTSGGGRNNDDCDEDCDDQEGGIDTVDTDSDVFVSSSKQQSNGTLNKQQQQQPQMIMGTDANNNNTCWSMHHTVSTNSLGRKSSDQHQPTDMYDYLMPSPCTDEHSHFSTYYSGSYEPKSIPISPLAAGPSSSIAQQQQHRNSHQPPHSAGIVSVNNEEYFMTRVNYVNQQQQVSNGGLEVKSTRAKAKVGDDISRRHSMSTSNGNIPQSLV